MGRADGLNSEIVQTYADRMEDGAEFPPIDIVDDGNTLWLVDGQLRLEAAKYPWGDREPDGSQCGFADRRSDRVLRQFDAENTWVNMSISASLRRICKRWALNKACIAYARQGPRCTIICFMSNN